MMKQEALKEWFANKKQILDSNKEYKVKLIQRICMSNGY